MENWTDRAACKGMPSEMFVLPDIEFRRLKGDGDPEFGKEFKRDAMKSLLAGKEVCDTQCTVWSECLFDASDDDKKVTTRGGELPSGWRSLCPSGAEDELKRLNSFDVDLLPEVRGMDYCPEGHPTSRASIEESGLAPNTMSKLGVTREGKCVRCKRNTIKRRTKRVRRPPAGASAT